MTAPDLRLLAPAVAVWVVAAVALHLPPVVVLVAASGAVLAAVVLAARGRRSGVAVVVVVLVCGAAAGVAAAARVHSRTAGVVHAAAADRAAVTIEGVLLDDPRLVAPKPGSGALVVRDVVVARVRAQRVTVAGDVIGVRTPVLVLSTGCPASDRCWRRRSSTGAPSTVASHRSTSSVRCRGSARASSPR